MKGKLLRTFVLLMLPLLLSAHRPNEATDAASALPCLQMRRCWRPLPGNHFANWPVHEPGETSGKDTTFAMQTMTRSVPGWPKH
ncbi:MAG: hypothetical protein Q9M35_11425 [Rhodothermus sp.]|nr:hypothetical protein [Rhodothermus sp.]